uniref:Uncharacterized protein n=1 Tax=Arcella intermedia TaxID=1963864 RepID=A0A6B2LA90_9EUKA
MIAQGSDARVTIFIRKVIANPTPSYSWDFNVVDIHHNTLITSFAWSPLSKSPSPENPTEETQLGFSTCGSDFKIQYFSVSSGKLNDKFNFSEKKSIKLGGHSDFINSCDFQYSSSLLLASTGDDNTCRIWDIEREKQLELIELQSPGRTVKWQSATQPDQIMIAEESGVLKFYDLRSRKVVLRFQVENRLATSDCFESGEGLDTNTLFGCAASNKWYLWQSQKAEPIYLELSAPLQHFKIHPQKTSYFATASHANIPNPTIWNIHSLSSPIHTPINHEGSTITGLSWLYPNKSDKDTTLVYTAGKYINFWQLST